MAQNSQQVTVKQSFRIEPEIPCMDRSFVLIAMTKTLSQKKGPHMHSFIRDASVHMKQG